MNSPSRSLSAAFVCSPCMTRIFTAVWLSRLVVKIFERLVGTVALGHPAPGPPGLSAARPRPPHDEVLHRGRW